MKDPRHTINNVFWSESGNYLIMTTKNSFKIYGGDKLVFIAEFIHTDVETINFSPNEKYLMSCNNPEKTKSSENVIVWDFYTRRKLRIFNLKKNLTENF